MYNLTWFNTDYLILAYDCSHGDGMSSMLYSQLFSKPWHSKNSYLIIVGAKYFEIKWKHNIIIQFKIGFSQDQDKNSEKIKQLACVPLLEFLWKWWIK